MPYTAKIYKIVNTINDDIYVGSTKNELRKRFYDHKRNAIHKKLNNGLYDMINEYSINCFRIILIEEIECKNKEQQLQYEQRFIDKLKPKLNKRNATGTKCVHNKQRSNCKECGGSQICKHNKRRSICKECGGGHICEHNKRRSDCKECGGSQMCEHNKRRSDCKECGGSQICKHNKRRSRCKECGGSELCEHNKYKQACKECGGVSVMPIYCYDCDCEITKVNIKRHYNSANHLQNILPVNL